MKKQLAAIFLVSVLFIQPSYGNKLKIEQFVSPETCGDCHVKIYEQWENSMHNQAHTDPIYNDVAEFLLKGLKDKDEIAEGESCVKCHTPIGNITGFPKKFSDDKTKTAEIATKGIQCDYCHSATGSSKPYNNGLIIEPGNGEDDPGVKRGPFKDSESDYHESAYSKFHTEAAVCGTCHDVKHVVFETPLETTYEEWQKSPYNSKDPANRVNCQGCHMYQRPGIAATGSTKRPSNKGTAAEDGPERDHIFTHYFVGGNSALPGLAGDKTKATMAEERLQNAAELSIDTKNIKRGEVCVTITNNGAGHYLPTGLTNVREMWLSVVVKDKAGKTVFSRGETDAKGYLGSDVILYNTVFGDGKGKPVTNISKAKEVLNDNRIPPQKSVAESFTFKSKPDELYSVNVKLLYRGASQKLLDTVHGKRKLTLPVVVMEEFNMKM